jgi:dienelactone hydrolase
MRRPTSRVRTPFAALSSMALIVGFAGAAVTAPAHAAEPLGLSCGPYGGQTICSGAVPSFDGSPLDVDVTLPEQGTGSSHPLIVLLHGFGNDKHEWESTTDEGDGADKYDWNNHWFARHGYYVLAYTARGFRTKDGTGYEPKTPPDACASACAAPLGQSTIRVKNKNVEIRDTQWLAANVAAAFPGVDPQRVAVTGGSYGGGESWLQAAEPVWSFPQDHQGDKTLPVLQLQVAVPKYPWTDLSYSLAPNGHGGGASGEDVYASAQGRQDDVNGAGYPVGVSKTSYISGLYALGTTNGVFEEGLNAAPQDLPPDPETDPATEPITVWLARIDSAEPYSMGPQCDDPAVRQIRRALTRWHSAYYQPGWAAQRASGRETAVFSISGWTDDLFPPVESFRMFKYLKSLDPLWPVAVATGDVGHSRAQNRPGVWHRLNAQAWQFLQSQINGAHRQSTTVTSEPTTCGDGTAPAERLTGKSPEDLANGQLVMDATSRPAVLDPSSGAADPDGLKTDAIAGDVVVPHTDCRASSAAAPSAGGPGGYRAMSAPLPRPVTTVGIGYVQAAYTASPGAAAVIAARVWDVAPDGSALLVSRGVYRLDILYGDAPNGTVRVPFYGNHWDLDAGHRLRLDLQQVDAPTYRPPNPEASTLNLTGIRLVLPIRSAASVTVPAG